MKKEINNKMKNKLKTKITRCLQSRPESIKMWHYTQNHWSVHVLHKEYVRVSSVPAYSWGTICSPHTSRPEKGPAQSDSGPPTPTQKVQCFIFLCTDVKIALSKFFLNSVIQTYKKKHITSGTKFTIHLHNHSVSASFPSCLMENIHHKKDLPPGNIAPWKQRDRALDETKKLTQSQ